MGTQRIQLRRDTEADWLASDPVLVEAEPAYITDTNELVIGDGATRFSSLPRFEEHIETSIEIVNYTGGAITLPDVANVWSAVDSSNLSLLAKAKATDVLAISLSHRPTTTYDQHVAYDVATIVNGSVANYIAAGGSVSSQGVPSWFMRAGQAEKAGGTWYYEVKPADVSSGQVRLELYHQKFTVASGVAAQFVGTENQPAQFSVVNMG